jgi:hypothetical protein
MDSLSELQVAFVKRIFSEADTGFGAQVRAHGLSGDRRLRVYRNNMLVSLTAALQAVYPVTQRLVGNGFFDFAATRYIQAHPSRSGDIHDFGAAFAEFLSEFEPAAGLPYLPDVARLEWAYHDVFHAAGHAPIDIEALRQVPETRYDDVRFVVHPAARLLASDYPILRIWQVNQKDYTGDESVDLAEGATKLLVIRRDLEIEMRPLGEGEFALLRAMADGVNFSTACERSVTTQEDVDVAAEFRKHVGLNTLVDFLL